MRQHLRWELQECHSLITYFGGLELEEVVVVCGGQKKLYQLKQFHCIFSSFVFHVIWIMQKQSQICYKCWACEFLSLLFLLQILLKNTWKLHTFNLNGRLCITFSFHIVLWFVCGGGGNDIYILCTSSTLSKFLILLEWKSWKRWKYGEN